MSNLIDVPLKDVRDIKTITAEIRTLTKQAQKMILNYAIEVGRRLCEAKSMLPHGQWGEYLKNEVEFSQSTANNFMKIFEEYGADQMTLDGAVAKSQTLGNLTYSKALKLLALPAEEREEFVQEHDVEGLSTRELDRILKEKEELRQSFETVQRKNAELSESLRAAQDDSEALKKAQEDERKKLEEKLQEAMQKEQEARAAADELKQQLEKPEIPAGEIEKIKNEARKDFEETVAKEREKTIELEAAIKKAEEDAERASQEAEKLRKQLAMANTEATMFKVHFEALQEGFNKLHGVYLRIEAAQPQQAEKLKRAMLAVVESFQKRLEG